MANDVLIVYCTLPAGDDRSAALCRALVEESLVACVNLLPEIRSIYRWQGQVCEDAEMLAIMKTTTARFEALRARILALHPYQCPEIIAVPLGAGHEPYLAWVREMTAG